MIRAPQEDCGVWTTATLFTRKLNVIEVVLWFGGDTYEGKIVVVVVMIFIFICIVMRVAYFQVLKRHTT